MNIRRIICGILCLSLLIVGLVGCNNEVNDNKDLEVLSGENMTEVEDKNEKDEQEENVNKENTLDDNIIAAKEKLLSGFDFNNVLSQQLGGTWQISVNDAGTELTFLDKTDELTSVKISGFSGKVKSMRYNLDAQVIFHGKLIMLSEEGKVYISEEQHGDDEKPEDFIVKEINTPFKVANIAIPGHVSISSNFYCVGILKYVNGDYADLDFDGTVVPKFDKFKMLNAIGDIPEMVAKAYMGIINLDDKVYRISYEEKDELNYVLKAYDNNNNSIELHEWNFTSDNIVDTELSIFKGKYLIVGVVAPDNSGIQSALLVFDKNLNEVAHENVFFNELDGNFDYEILEDKVLFSAYEFLESADVSGMTKLYRVYYELVEENGELKVNTIREDKTDTSYTAAT